MISRRQILAAAALLPSARALARPESASRMGGAPTAFNAAMRAAREQKKPFDVVEHCHQLGLSGAEASLPSTDPAAVKAFRQKAEGYGMRTVLNARLPASLGDVAAFDAAVAACKECGAFALHAAMTARRYEQFDSFEAFRKNFEQNQKSVALAEPVLRKHRIKLAVENHKGWRAAEQAAWLKSLGSEWVGVCLDFGNNLSLSEPPEETFELLSPMAIFCHIKDMGLESYKDGFLLSEVPFGQGIIPLKRMVDTLRKKDPDMLFCLEMITRDPLKVPVFTDRYWSSFDDAVSPVPGHDLARVLELVHKNPPKTPLPNMQGLNIAQQAKLEDEYNRKCIQYASKNLEL